MLADRSMFDPRATCDSCGARVHAVVVHTVSVGKRTARWQSCMACDEKDQARWAEQAADKEREDAERLERQKQAEERDRERVEKQRADKQRSA